MVILREKGRSSMSRNLVFRNSSYSTLRICTVPPLHKINTYERYMKIHSMLHIPNIPGDGDSLRLKYDYLSGIYLTVAIEAEFCVVT